MPITVKWEGKTVTTTTQKKEMTMPKLLYKVQVGTSSDGPVRIYYFVNAPSHVIRCKS